MPIRRVMPMIWCRFHEFGGIFRFDVVIVDDPKAPNSFDPGVHDQVGGGFTPFGVGIVDMVVEGELVPRLGHFQKVVKAKLAAHHAGLAGGGGAKIVGQLQLADLVAVGPDQFFHDLKEHPGRVDGERARCCGQDFVPKGAKGDQSPLGGARAHGVDEPDRCVGHAQSP